VSARIGYIASIEREKLWLEPFAQSQSMPSAIDLASFSSACP
jgi:hypothetical protein